MKNQSHMVIVYQDLWELRDIYSSFIRHALTNNERVILLHHYDNPDSIQHYLHNVDIDISRYENESSLLILDSYKSQFGLRYNKFDSIIKMLQKSRDRKTKISIIADMGSFFSRGKGIENRKHLLQFEYSLPKRLDLGINRLCLYHNQDLKRLSDNERQSLYKAHLQCFILNGNN